MLLTPSNWVDVWTAGVTPRKHTQTLTQGLDTQLMTTRQHGLQGPRAGHLAAPPRPAPPAKANAVFYSTLVPE